MTVPDTSSWTHVGKTSNAAYYVIEPGMLAVVPDAGSFDNEATAVENIGFQNRHFRESAPGVSLIFIESSASMDKGARRVYREQADTEVFLGASMIGGTLLARAIGSFFLGLAQPTVPFKMFATLPEARTWARTLIDWHAGTGPS